MSSAALKLPRPDDDSAPGAPPPPVAATTSPTTSSTVPPPPQAGQEQPHHFRAVMEALTGGGVPAIHKEVEADYQRHLATIDMYQKSLQQAAGDFLKLEHTRDNEHPWGWHTIENKPATEEEYKRAQQAYQVAQEAFNKVLRPSKGASGIAKKMEGFLGHFMGKGQAQAQGAAPTPPPAAGGAPAPGAKGGGGPSPITTTAPPPPQAQAGAGGDGRLQALGGPALATETAEREKIAGTIATRKGEAEASAEVEANKPARMIKEMEKILGRPMTEHEKQVYMGLAPPSAEGGGWEPDIKEGKVVGMKNTTTKEYIVDPNKMPAQAKEIFDRMKQVEQQKEAEQEAKENRQLQRQMQMQAAAMQKALEVSDYKAAKKVITDTNKDYDSAIDRTNTMDKNLASAVKGDQQAMLSLVANHIGMTLGAQKGARITRAVWEEAVESAPWLERVGARFDERGLLKGVALTPDQMKQMVNLAHEKLDILKDHVDRVKDEYQDALAVKRSKVTRPPKAQAAKGESKKVLVEGVDF